MKTIFTLIFATTLAALVPSSAWAQSTYTSVMFPLQSMFGGVGYSKPIVITAAYPLVSDGTTAFVGTTLQVPVGATNVIVLLVPNDYMATFPDARPALRFSVPASTNVLNVINLTSGLHPYNFHAPWAGDITNSLSTASNAVVSGLWPSPGGGGGGVSVWTSSGGVIFPNGNSGTNNGWISSGSTLFPQ